MIGCSAPFRNWSIRPEKGVNYHQKYDSYSNFTSVKKTSSLDNIFTFKESEKSLKKTPSSFLFVMNGFYEPEKKRK